METARGFSNKSSVVRKSLSQATSQFGYLRTAHGDAEH